MKLGAQQCTVLWHLMEEGTASCPQLAELSGIEVDSLYRVTRTLLERGLIQNGYRLVQEKREKRGAPPKLYALTPEGITRALNVNRIDVHFAKEHLPSETEA